MNETDFLQHISELDLKIKKFRSKQKHFQKKISDLETELIGVKLIKDNLLEELRLFRLKKGIS